jgi:hypothetical protein
MSQNRPQIGLCSRLALFQYKVLNELFDAMSLELHETVNENRTLNEIVGLLFPKKYLFLCRRHPGHFWH